jgi:hypothetical protein
MAVGLPLKTTYTNGDVYSASDVNDTNGTINITAAPYAAGKNKIINGDFGIWQRGTSFSGIAQRVHYADRWTSNWTAGGATNTFSRQTFTPGTAPVAGYEGTFFARAAATSGSASTQIGQDQRIEDVRTFAGQTVTLSYWAKADSARTLSYYLSQNFGSGGSTEVSISVSTQAITTSWARYSVTFALPSIAGKTIGTSSYVNTVMLLAPGQASGSPQLDLWGVQLEAGSTATAFQTASGTIGGELALCQRYYTKSFNQATAPAQNTSIYEGAIFGGPSVGNISFIVPVQFPVTMRTAPSITTYAPDAATANWSNQAGAVPTVSILNIGDRNAGFRGTTSTAAGGAHSIHYAASSEL